MLSALLRQPAMCACPGSKDIYLCQGGVPEAGDDLVVDAVVRVALRTLLAVKVDLRAGPTLCELSGRRAR